LVQKSIELHIKPQCTELNVNRQLYLFIDNYYILHMVTWNCTLVLAVSNTMMGL